MDLSIVIVNYNVKFFLEQCLHSVAKAISGISAEVFVVDNNSVDESCAMVKSKFPWVQLIENKENTGFSKANNQAMRIAKGRYILLLNPDTLVEEDSFQKSLDYMNARPKAGALSVKMIDGSGVYLPESKRALPTPKVSFYKIFGLTSMFPRSKEFARYYFGHLDEDENNEIEILPGAYMFMRKEALDKVGLLDESFFMYGEDIDLSYRILLGGYTNHYLAETTIIHYKGESTKKGSLNYVMVFYNAMLIFAKKHFSDKGLHFYSFFINLAIYLRAALSVCKRFVNKVALPLLDFSSVFIAYLIILPIWEQVHFKGNVVYPELFRYGIIPGYILIWLISLFYSSAYDKPVKLFNILKGVGVGGVLILSVYALLPADMRFSRILILFGAILVLVFTILNRVVLAKCFRQNYFQNEKKKNILLIADKKEEQRVLGILKRANIFYSSIKCVPPQCLEKNIEDLIRINSINEIIFSAKNLDSISIIRSMLRCSDMNCEFKIAPPESMAIIGSNSIDSLGELYTLTGSFIATPGGKRSKRTFDVLLSLLFVILLPGMVFIIPRFFSLLRNIGLVLLAKKSWVGSNAQIRDEFSSSRHIKEGILVPVELSLLEEDRARFEGLYIQYVRNYRWWLDLVVIRRSFRCLSN